MKSIILTFILIITSDLVGCSMYTVETKSYDYSIYDGSIEDVGKVTAYIQPQGISIEEGREVYGSSKQGTYGLNIDFVLQPNINIETVSMELFGFTNKDLVFYDHSGQLKKMFDSQQGHYTYFKSISNLMYQDYHMKLDLRACNKDTGNCSKKTIDYKFERKIVVDNGWVL